MNKPKQKQSHPVKLHAALNDTNDLIDELRKLWNDVGDMSVSISEARAKALIAREMLNAKRIEMMAQRIGLTEFNPVSFRPMKTIEIDNEE